MNFLARAVHDFRTLLTAVNGYCGLLLSEELGPLTSLQKEVLERTMHGVRRLSRLAPNPAFQGVTFAFMLLFISPASSLQSTSLEEIHT